MNERERLLTEALLEALAAQLEPTADAVLHALVQIKTVRHTFEDFAAILKNCEREKWVKGTHSRVKGINVWQITDAGRLALAEL